MTTKSTELNPEQQPWLWWAGDETEAIMSDSDWGPMSDGDDSCSVEGLETVFSWDDVGGGVLWGDGTAVGSPGGGGGGGGRDDVENGNDDDVPDAEEFEAFRRHIIGLMLSEWGHSRRQGPGERRGRGASPPSGQCCPGCREGTEQGRRPFDLFPFNRCFAVGDSRFPAEELLVAAPPAFRPAPKRGAPPPAGAERRGRFLRKRPR